VHRQSRRAFQLEPHGLGKVVHRLNSLDDISGERPLSQRQFGVQQDGDDLSKQRVPQKRFLRTSWLLASLVQKRVTRAHAESTANATSKPVSGFSLAKIQNGMDSLGGSCASIAKCGAYILIPRSMLHCARIPNRNSQIGTTIAGQ